MEFRVLGPLEVREGGQPLSLGGGKQRMLLALLLLHEGQVVSTDRLIDALWGERPPASAANSVHVYVSQLRKLLGDGRVLTRGHGYLLAVEEDELDRSRFERLLGEGRALLAKGDAEGAAETFSAALSLWRGPALGDFQYESFARAEIDRLEELRLTALEERIDAELVLGRAPALVSELEERVRSHPLRERLRGQLMLALYRSGRQAEALEVYRSGRRVLVEELGLEPDPALQELERAILAHDPALRAPADGGGAEGLGRSRRGLLVAGGAALLIAAAVAAAIVELTSGGGASLSPVAPGSVAVIDSSSRRIGAATSIAGGPARLAFEGRTIWVGSDDSGTLSAIGVRSQQQTKVVATGGFPSDLAVGEGAVWVIDGKNGLLRKIDPAYGVAGSVRVAAPNPAYDVSRESFDSTSVAAGAGSVWVTTGTRRLVRVDPRTRRVVDRIDLRSPLNGVAAGADAVWAISGASATAIRLDGRGRVTVRIPIVSRPGFESPYPLMVRLGEGFVWVLNANTATVTKIDPEQRTVSATIPIGIDRGPARLAVGAGAAWVANRDGTLSRIDPSSNAVTTIRVGHRLKDVAVGGGNAWVTTATGLSGNESATVTGGRVRALPTSSCSPIYFEGRGRPQYLIASDLPLQGNGTLVPQLSQAIQLVLRQHRFRAGPYAVGYQSCDDSTAPEGFMSEARCAANARAYARDTGVIGVIGAFNSGCSAVELPILNRAANGPLAMISPTNTVVGLTRAGPGTAPGEPGRYYPTGIRNYARIAATDNVQAAADAIQVRQLGARKISVLYEPYGYGRGLAAAFASAAAKLGLTVVARQSFQYDLPRYTPLVTQVERAHPDAVLIAGVASTSTVEMIKELRVALGPGVKIMATDGFSDLDLLLKLAGAAAEGMTVSAPGVPNEQLPAKGRQFVAAFGKAVGEGPGPYPAYAAQAAEVLLDAIARSNGTRASVTKQLFMTSVKNGILGTFSIDRHGDTTAGAITIYRIVRGKPTVLSVITPPRRLVER